jgi:Flp pilus assembly protein TadG
VSRLFAFPGAGIRTGRTHRRAPILGLSLDARSERGVAAVEFALILPLLLVLLLGIIDFGLYYYSDLQLTQSARDAARYLSLGEEDDAWAVINNLQGDPPPQTSVSGSVTPGAPLGQCSVSLTGTYTCLTPLPRLIGIDQELSIVVSATMREGK